MSESNLLENNSDPGAKVAWIRWIQIASLLSVCLAMPVYSQDAAREEWKAQIEQRRARAAQAAQSQPGPETTSPSAANSNAPNPNAAGGEKKGIVINGKVITSKQKNFAGPPPGKSTAEALSSLAALLSATAAPVAATPQSVQPPQPVPVPTPALVKIKKTQIVGGKILTVEIEVTPTPSPSVAPEAVAAADNPTEASSEIASATGRLLEVREKLLIAARSPTGSMRFEPNLIATLREEFMANKGKPHVAAIVPPTRELQIQSHLQRLSSVARGGNIDNETAQILLQMIFPPSASQATAPPPGAPQSSPPGHAPAAPGPPAGGPPVEQPQVYLDQYGRYVYEDGTPLLDENGQEIYYEAPQGYYDENGVFHEATN